MAASCRPLIAALPPDSRNCPALARNSLDSLRATITVLGPLAMPSLRSCRKRDRNAFCTDSLPDRRGAALSPASPGECRHRVADDHVDPVPVSIPNLVLDAPHPRFDQQPHSGGADDGHIEITVDRHSSFHETSEQQCLVHLGGIARDQTGEEFDQLLLKRPFMVEQEHNFLREDMIALERVFVSPSGSPPPHQPLISESTEDFGGGGMRKTGSPGDLSGTGPESLRKFDQRAKHPHEAEVGE